MTKNIKTIYLAGGCFWGVEAAFRKFLGIGVTDTMVGYAGGEKENPNYEEVCSGRTGHAETVKVEFDEQILPLEKILELFWKMHDPTSLNKQGNDIGSQYRSAIYFTDDDQLKIINKQIENLNNFGSKKIVTEVKKITHFYPAEDYHQKYLEKNPGGYCHINLDEISL